MQRDLLIPTSGDLDRLKPLLESISSQSILPDNIIFLLHGSPDDKYIANVSKHMQDMLGDTNVFILHHQNSDFVPHQGVGYDRNFLTHQAQSEHLFMIDDDNVFGTNFFELCIQEYQKFEDENSNAHLQILYSPQIEYRNSGKIQSAGITGFRRWLPKMRYARAGSEQEIQMIGANSLLGPKTLFQEIGFDAQFKSCLEDIDFSYRVRLSGAKIVVSKTIKIQHMEQQKSFLEKKFLGSPKIAYERSRNRILFAKKNATMWQKIQYFGLGLWGQTFWFLVLSLVYGGRERFKIFGNALRGTFDGLLR